jgi:hypothetical protein
MRNRAEARLVDTLKVITGSSAWDALESLIEFNTPAPPTCPCGALPESPLRKC